MNRYLEAYRLMAKLRRRLKPLGINPNQAFALWLCRDGALISEIEAAMDIVRPQAYTLVLELKRNYLVARSPVPRGRTHRSRDTLRVTLTEGGKTLLARLEHIMT